MYQLHGRTATKIYAGSSSPVTESVMYSGSPAQSTCIASPGLWEIRMVAFVTRAQRRYFSQNCVYMYGTPPLVRTRWQYSSQSSVSVTPFLASSSWMYRKSGTVYGEAYAYFPGNRISWMSSLVTPSSKGQVIPAAADWTRTAEMVCREQ